MKLEGSGSSQLIEAIKHLTKSSETIELATVVSPVPDVKIKLDGTNLILDKDFLVLTSSVTDIAINDRVVVASVQNGQTYILLDKVVSV